MEVTQRPDWQQRVVTEKIELEDKINKLRTHLSTDKFRGLPAAEQALQTMQLHYMTGYHQVLVQRINRYDAAATV